MKKIVFVIPPKDFRDVELLKPKQILAKNNVETKIASTRLGSIIGADGAQVEAEYKVTDLEPDDFVAVIFIGGPGTIPMVDNKIFKDVAKRFFKAGKITAAICVAPAILANADILSGKNATSWPGVQKILTDRGANWQNIAVVVDGQIITAQGPDDAIEFGCALENALSA